MLLFLYNQGVGCGKVKYKKLIIFTVSFLLVLAIISFFGGIYFQINSKPKIIFKKSFDAAIETINQYILPSDDLFVGDSFTIDSFLDFNLDSEYYSKQDTLENIKKYHLIQNLNQMDTHFLLMHNDADKIFSFQLSQYIGSEEINTVHLLVDDATEYYFVNQFIEYYINNGTCNYFETLNGENTTKDNIEYLYYFILNSVRNNIMKEHFSQFEVKQSVNGKIQKVHKISIQFTDYSIHTVLNGVLNDLKKDKKSYFILKSVYKDFSKYKIKKSTHFLDESESYTLNIYTSNFLYKPLKYEVIHNNKIQLGKFFCEMNHSSIDLFYEDNYSHNYHMVSTLDGNNIKMKVFNSNDKRIGEFHFERVDNDIIANLSFDDNYLKYDFFYSSKVSKLKKNQSYYRDRKLSFKIVRDKVGLLNGDIKVTSKMENKVKKIESVSSTKLSSRLSDSEKECLKTRKNTIMARLER